MKGTGRPSHTCSAAAGKRHLLTGSTLLQQWCKWVQRVTGPGSATCTKILLSLLLTPYALSASAPVPSCRLAAEQHDSSSDPCDAVVNSPSPFNSLLNTVLPLTSAPAFLLLDLFHSVKFRELMKFKFSTSISRCNPTDRVKAEQAARCTRVTYHGEFHWNLSCFSLWALTPPAEQLLESGVQPQQPTSAGDLLCWIVFFDKCTNAKGSSSFHSHCRVTARCLREGRKPALAHGDLQEVSFRGAAAV